MYGMAAGMRQLQRGIPPGSSREARAQKDELPFFARCIHSCWDAVKELHLNYHSRHIYI